MRLLRNNMPKRKHSEFEESSFSKETLVSVETPTLDSLPVEIKLHLNSFFTTRDLSNLKLLNQNWYSIILDERKMRMSQLEKALKNVVHEDPLQAAQARNRIIELISSEKIPSSPEFLESKLQRLMPDFKKLKKESGIDFEFIILHRPCYFTPGCYPSDISLEELLSKNQLINRKDFISEIISNKHNKLQYFVDDFDDPQNHQERVSVILEMFLECVLMAIIEACRCAVSLDDSSSGDGLDIDFGLKMSGG